MFAWGYQDKISLEPCHNETKYLSTQKGTAEGAALQETSGTWTEEQRTPDEEPDCATDGEPRPPATGPAGGHSHSGARTACSL